MTPYVKSLREQQARLSTSMRAIVSKAESENRGLSGDENISWQNQREEYSRLEASVKVAEQTDTMVAALATPQETRIVPIDAAAAVAVNGRGGRDDSPRAKAFSAYLRYGREGLDPEQRAVLGSPVGDIRNAQTISTTGGGYLIPTGFSDALEEAMKWYGGILGNVDEFATETGAPLPWPTVNDTANMGRILGVNTQLTENDLVYAQVSFGAYIFTSDSVLVPLALVQDSYFDIDAHIAKMLGIRLGRIQNNKYTVGTGTNEPNGIKTAVVAAGNIVTGPTGETTSISYNDLVNLLHKVDPAYRGLPSTRYMFHDSTLQALRLLKDSSGRPLWQPGISAGFGGGFPDTILNYRYVINNDMPVMAANAYSVLFGDLSKYKVRKVAGGTTVMRLVERYADYLQVGYLAFLRGDGQLLDAGTHPIAAFQNSAT